MEAFIRLTKWVLITGAALVVLVVVGYFSNAVYSDYQTNKALTLRTNHSDWQWQRDGRLGDRSSTAVQWRINDEGDYTMRRVYDEYRVVVSLRKNQDSAIELIARVYWPADCEKDSSIKTSVTDQDDKYWHLKCIENDWGNELSLGSGWGDFHLSRLPVWSKNYDGFEIYEDFNSYLWNFQPALRQLTLRSAKRIEEAE